MSDASAGNGMIRVRGAREHNLRGIDVDIPRESLTVVTGLSGSGKSSLAFDTIYVEGQRRYVESLSAYARQFLQNMQKPNVEQIVGLPPTIAIEQRKGGGNPRSTVATITEIYDYFRLLYARAGTPHCWRCGKEIAHQTVQQIVDRIAVVGAGKKAMILAPLVRGRKGGHKDVLAMLRREGYVRVRVDGEMHETPELKEVPDKRRKHTVEAVVDRLVLKDKFTARLTEAVEASLRMSGGLVLASVEKNGGWADAVYSENYACIDCNVSMSELEPRMFSFNSPYGACPACDGLGTRLELDPELIVPDPALSIGEGAVEAFRKGGKRMAIHYHYLLRDFCRDYGVSQDLPFNKLPKKVREILLYGDPEGEHGPGFEGVVPNLERRFHNTDSDYVKQRIHEYMSVLPCPDCHGARLKPEALAVTVDGLGIHELTRFTVVDALERMQNLELSKERAAIAEPIVRETVKRLSFMADVGLGYLTLDRTAGTLSGGEAQRIRLASQVGSGLVGVCYVLDEPTIGLHQRDNDRLLRTLLKLRDSGNTVIVVEHDEEVIRTADHLLDLGPGAGVGGGDLVAAGTVAEVMADEKSVTGAYLSGREGIAVPEKRRKAKVRAHALKLTGASENNLKNITAVFPLSTFICVTGVSGSGKSTLVRETLYKALHRSLYGSHQKPGKYNKLHGLDYIDKVINIDQSPIGKTPRSNPATYTGVFDDIRKLFAQVPEAKIRGYKPGRFSFNVKGGRCEHCQGAGVMRIEMHFLPDVFVTCEQCGGKRYNRETLEVKYKGKTVSEVLDMSIAEACRFFRNIPTLREGLNTLADVGLGYVALGQSSTTLSGGEAQRVKLASELAKRATGGTAYILDEPTTGLHFADIRRLLDVLNRLVNRGNTVIVIEHNLDVIKSADWLIDLGPEGGEAGGAVVATGTPEAVAACDESYTGQYLRTMLG